MDCYWVGAVPNLKHFDLHPKAQQPASNSQAGLRSHSLKRYYNYKVPENNF